MNIKYMFGSLKKLGCPVNSDTNSIANLKQTIEILQKWYQAVAPPSTLSGDFSVTSQNLACAIGCRRRKPPRLSHVTERLQWGLQFYLTVPFEWQRRVHTLIATFLVMAHITSLLLILRNCSSKLESFVVFIAFFNLNNVFLLRMQPSELPNTGSLKLVKVVFCLLGLFNHNRPLLQGEKVRNWLLSEEQKQCPCHKARIHGAE